ncbi:MAG TPA: hypothetical protein VML58_06510 [Burkholderiaceae bacterium]|nr:hypothetical protein [Burkholderiaceae bacterium]
MANILTKTEAGQRELRDRAVELPRSARTLLVLVDGVRNSDELLTMVKGATADDVDALVRAGLITVGAAVGVSKSAAAKVASAAAAPAQAEAVVKLDYKELYACLNEMIREQLGVMKAFKYTLEVEKAQTVDDLQVVARRFIDDVQKAKGESAANMVRRALGITA